MLFLARVRFSSTALDGLQFINFASLSQTFITDDKNYVNCTVVVACCSFVKT